MFIDVHPAGSLTCIFEQEGALKAFLISFRYADFECVSRGDVSVLFSVLIATRKHRLRTTSTGRQPVLLKRGDLKAHSGRL